ncbi:MAG: LysR family transcriptional regulator [Sulfitobacter sp.]|nr:LysR family transcriptional regulator [Sulfitobacter sp.]
MLTYRQLTHIQALSRHGSFRKAAASMNLSHPAFSRSIARAEELLGVKLFDRQPSGVVPTDVGALVIDRGTFLIDRREELLREVELMQGLDQGDISISMGPYAADISGYAGAARLLGKHPALKFNLISRGWQESIDLVLARKVDLAYAESSDAEQEQLEVETIGRPPFVFFGRFGHPLTQQQQIKKEDFDPFPLALSRLPKRVKNLFPCRMRKDEQPDFLVPPLNCENTHLSRYFVRESDAVSVATMTQIKEELRAGIFQVIPFWQKWMHLNYGFIYLRGRTLAPAVVSYMDETRELERELTEEGNVLWEQFVPKRIATATAAYR